MSYSNGPIYLRVAGGEWHRFTGEKARNLDHGVQTRETWTTSLDAVRALDSEEVKARRSEIEKEMGGLGSVWDRKKGPQRPDGGRPKDLYRLREDVEVRQDREAEE